MFLDIVAKSRLGYLNVKILSEMLFKVIFTCTSNFYNFLNSLMMFACEYLVCNTAKIAFKIIRKICVIFLNNTYFYILNIYTK